MFVHLTMLTPKLPALVLCMPPSADVWCFAFAAFATGSCWRMSWSAWRCLRGFSERGIRTWRWWVCRTLSSGGRYRSARWAPLWLLPTKAKLRRKRKKRRTKTDLWIWCVVYRSSRDYWVPRFTSYKRTRRRNRKRQWQTQGRLTADSLSWAAPQHHANCHFVSLPSRQQLSGNLSVRCNEGQRFYLQLQ